MNLKSSLKIFVAIVLLAGLNNAARAVAALPAPKADLYVVYSGTSTDATFSGGSTSTATTSHVSTIYLILDLANPSNFSILDVGADKTYQISTRVLSADGSSVTTYDNGTQNTGGNATRNFVNGVENQATSNLTSPTKGYTVFRFNGGGTKSLTINNVTHDYPKSIEVYATGISTGLSRFVATTIVAADSKTKVSGVYTVNAIEPALTNYIGTLGNANTTAYPLKLSGQLFSYAYDPTLVAVPVQNFQAIDYLDVSGTITLTLNTTLTSLANVGGSFKLTGQLVATTINPVANPLTASSSPTLYEDFLIEIVQSLALPAGYVPTP
jgi:hypothetical protein